MQGKLNKKIGFALMPFAFLFLFEPGYAILDLIPDFIGYLILCLSIVNLADINTRISEALTGFRKAGILSILRFVATVLLEVYFSESEKTVGHLTFVFVFALFEAIFVLPAYKNLFEGLLSIGMFYDGEAIYRQKRAGKPNITEKTYWLTVAFVIIKNVVCALPEFTSLISNSSYEFVLLLRVFAIIITLPIGILWLIKIIRYVNGIKADTQFIEKISAHYIEKSTSNPQLYVVRGLNMGFYTIIAALVLSIDLYADNINILPDVLFYAVTIIAAILLKKSSKRWTVLVVASSLGAVASVAAHIMTDNYFREYSIGSIRRDEQAYYAYYSTLAVYVAEAIISVITVTLLTVIIWDVYKNHGEVSRNTDLSTEKRSFYIFAGIFVLLGFFASFADVYRLWSLPFFHRGWIFYYSTVISMALDIIFAGYACYFVGVIRDNIKRNYRLYL